MSEPENQAVEVVLPRNRGGRPKGVANRERDVQYALAVDARGLEKLLPFSAEKLWNMNKLAQLPRAYKIGNSLVWRRSDIAKWSDLGFPCRADFERLTAPKGGAA